MKKILEGYLEIMDNDCVNTLYSKIPFSRHTFLCELNTEIDLFAGKKIRITIEEIEE